MFIIKNYYYLYIDNTKDIDFDYIKKNKKILVIYRNNKITHNIEELKTFGCVVDVYDPWVNPKDEKSNYKHGIIENPFKNDKKYDSIIVAVAHKEFKELTENDYNHISNDIPVIMDIKGIVKNPNWRL